MGNWTFDAPGGMKDFSDPTKWHDAMQKEANDIVQILVGSALGIDADAVTQEDIDAHQASLSYANPTVSPPPPEAETIPVQPWNGFPRAVRRRAPWKQYPSLPSDIDGSYRAVEHLGEDDFAPGVFIDRHDRVLHLPVRHRQDEYLEWVAQRDGNGNIIKLTFVAEGYDYYASLFKSDPDRVVELYSAATGLDKLKADDLRAVNGVYRRLTDGRVKTVVEPGDFNPRNRFNIHPGIVHLSHQANSLGAEINLAGVSAIARRDGSGQMIDGLDSERLLCCNAGGNPNRNSDPLISAQAYAQVLGGYRYTLANPVGLYISGVDEASLLLPDNSTSIPREWWNVSRGHDLWDNTASRVLRLELEIPAHEKLTISDLLIGGDPVKYPGQIAELLSVHLFVTRWPRGDGGIGPVVDCLATCCREQGKQKLEFSEDGGCSPGYDLAFPGLLKPAAPALMRPSLLSISNKFR